jgi:GDPmannose 4,6-dehydratase
VGLNYRKYVRTSDEFKRPLEVEKLCGDASRIRALGWVPHIGFETMIKEMVDAQTQ